MFVVVIPFLYSVENKQRGGKFTSGQLEWKPAVFKTLPDHLSGHAVNYDIEGLMGFYGFANLGIFGILTVCRLSLYLQGYHPPISLWGRIFTLRWIIPKYDSVFIAPIVALLVLITFTVVNFTIRISPLFLGPLTTISIVLALLNIGPTRSHWHFTSPCRIVTSAIYKSKITDGFGEI